MPKAAPCRAPSPRTPAQGPFTSTMDNGGGGESPPPLTNPAKRPKIGPTRSGRIGSFFWSSKFWKIFKNKGGPRQIFENFRPNLAPDPSLPPVCPPMMLIFTFWSSCSSPGLIQSFCISWKVTYILYFLRDANFDHWAKFLKERIKTNVWQTQNAKIFD